MYLKKLERKDAPLVFSMMKDERELGNVYVDFSSKTIAEYENFLESAKDISNDVYFAIFSDEDEYMGIVSLKHIDREVNSAEFAISVRKEAMGRGYAWFGMETIFEKAFNQYGLECVYWCVSKKNQRAVRFFEKHNFHEAVDISNQILERYIVTDNIKWYSVLKGDTFDERESVSGCKVVRIKTIPTLDAGELSFFESHHDIEFDIKRVYYISKVPEGVRRGFHAHKELKQLLFCPYGKIQLILENELGREEIELSDPSIGVVIDRPTWREMLWLQKNSVLCVAASDYYNAKDYIRDYNEFLEIINEKKSAKS